MSLHSNLPFQMRIYVVERTDNNYLRQCEMKINNTTLIFLYSVHTLTVHLPHLNFLVKSFLSHLMNRMGPVT